jgi:glycosyltransferase involved in cell wall biosynthesis
VAAFARGGLCEVVRPGAGVLAAPDDVGSLADAIDRAARLDRREVRRHAVDHYGVDTMVDRYETVYRDVTAPRLAVVGAEAEDPVGVTGVVR